MTALSAFDAAFGRSITNSVSDYGIAIAEISLSLAHQRNSERTKKFVE
jgi:hypothetical protein